MRDTGHRAISRIAEGESNVFIVHRVDLASGGGIGRGTLLLPLGLGIRAPTSSRVRTRDFPARCAVHAGRDRTRAGSPGAERPRGHVRRRRRLSAVRGAHRTVGKQPISASGAPPRRSSGGDGSFPPIVRITDRRCHDLTTISPAHPTRVALHAAHRTVNRAAADVRKAARAVPSPPRPLYLPPDPASDHRGHPHARTPHDRPHPGRSLGHGSPARHPSPSAFPRWFAMPAAPARPPTPRTRPRPHDSIRHEWTGKARTRRCDSNCSGH